MPNRSFVVRFYAKRGVDLEVVDTLELPTEDQAIEIAKVGSLKNAGTAALEMDGEKVVRLLRAFGVVPQVIGSLDLGPGWIAGSVAIAD